jgi:hypothetical protein
MKHMDKQKNLGISNHKILNLIQIKVNKNKIELCSFSFESQNLGIIH